MFHYTVIRRFVSSRLLGLLKKLRTDFDEIFWSCGYIAERSDYILGPINCTKYLQDNQQAKKWGLGGGLHSLSASNFLPLAALFHSDNLMEKEYK